MDTIIEPSGQVLDRKSVLKEYYARYLKDVRGLSDSSVKKYFDALNHISRRLKDKGLVQLDIYEIADLNSLYMIRNIGPNKAKKIIDIIHSYGFLFENEKIIKKNGEKEINNILENLYQKLDLKFISEEFYEKVITPEDFNTNYFVLSFTKLVKDLNEKKNIYLTDKEITSFLYKKLLNNKKKLLEISNNISKKLELKKVNILK